MSKTLMPNAANILAQQFEEESESWKPSGELRLCWMLEDFIRLGLRQFHAIRAEDEAWSSRVQAGNVKFSPEIARHVRGRYEWWEKPCAGVLACIEAIERDTNWTIDGANEFRTARLFVRAILATPIDEVIGAMERVALGQFEML